MNTPDSRDLLEMLAEPGIAITHNPIALANDMIVTYTLSVAVTLQRRDDCRRSVAISIAQVRRRNISMTTISRFCLAHRLVAVLALAMAAHGCSAVGSTALHDVARPQLAAPYTSDPFSMLQRFGKPKLTASAQQYWDKFTPDMDPAIQCLPANLARDLFSPAGVLVRYLDNGDIKLSNETVHMDGRDFPAEYSMARRGNWPTSNVGYSIGHWQDRSLLVETRGVVERDILIGHIPILPSNQMIIRRQFKLVDMDQRWEARGLAPQEVNSYLVSKEDGGKTLEMDVWLDDPKSLQEVWHTVKQYREVNNVAAVTSAGDIPVDPNSAVKWEGTAAAANSGVPEEFLKNYDGGCVLFPEYDTSGTSAVSDFVPAK